MMSIQQEHPSVVLFDSISEIDVMQVKWVPKKITFESIMLPYASENMDKNCNETSNIDWQRQAHSQWPELVSFHFIISCSFYRKVAN